MTVSTIALVLVVLLLVTFALSFNPKIGRQPFDVMVLVVLVLFLLGLVGRA